MNYNYYRPAHVGLPAYKNYHSLTDVRRLALETVGVYFEVRVERRTKEPAGRGRMAALDKEREGAAGPLCIPLVIGTDD